jgi:hypothetical protein
MSREGTNMAPAAAIEAETAPPMSQGRSRRSIEGSLFKMESS